MAKGEKRNPQDATLRNVRAAKGRETKVWAALLKLQARQDALEQRVEALAVTVASNEARVTKVEQPV